ACLNSAMFINCRHCHALVATDPATDLPPERCPRCRGVLRRPDPADPVASAPARPPAPALTPAPAPPPPPVRDPRTPATGTVQPSDTADSGQPSAGDAPPVTVQAAQQALPSSPGPGGGPDHPAPDQGAASRSSSP